MVDLELMPGTLGVRQKYYMDGTLISHMTPSRPQCFTELGGNQTTWMKLRENKISNSYLRSGSNWRPCKVAPAAPATCCPTVLSNYLNTFQQIPLPVMESASSSKVVGLDSLDAWVWNKIQWMTGKEKKKEWCLLLWSLWWCELLLECQINWTVPWQKEACLVLVDINRSTALQRQTSMNQQVLHTKQSHSHVLLQVNLTFVEYHVTKPLNLWQDSHSEMMCGCERGCVEIRP